MATAFPDEIKVTSDQPYSSLSILALIGFGIGALHAAAIVVMTVVGLFNQTPLLMSLWALLVPLSAILFCLLARGRIRSSEGTLAGETLVRWGLLLTLFTALGYWAYYTAVYFAVQQQARAYADEWIDQLRSGDTTRAAVGVLPPLKRLGLNALKDDSVLLMEVEQRMAGIEGPGRPDKPTNLLSSFNQYPLVRRLVQGSMESKVVFKGVSSWSYVRGGYEVVLLYELELPEGASQATITVHGQTAPQNEFERRQWYVEMKQSRLNDQDALSRMTDQGRATVRISELSSRFLRQWQLELTGSNRQGPFLLSLPPEQRDKAEKDLDKVGALAAATGPLGAALALPEGSTLESLERFRDGKLIETDPKRFRLGDQERQEVLAEMRNLFARNNVPLRIEPARTIPLRSRKGEKIRFEHDVQISGLSPYVVDAVVEVECDAKAAEAQKSQLEWRFITLRLLAARKIAMQK